MEDKVYRIRIYLITISLLMFFCGGCYNSRSPYAMIENIRKGDSVLKGNYLNNKIKKVHYLMCFDTDKHYSYNHKIGFYLKDIYKITDEYYRGWYLNYKRQILKNKSYEFLKKYKVYDSLDGSLYFEEQQIDRNPPSVYLSNVYEGYVYKVAQTVSFVADAYDENGIARVDFYANGAFIGVATNYPYILSLPVTAAQNGHYELFALAYDVYDNKAQSSSVMVTVDIPGTNPEHSSEVLRAFPGAEGFGTQTTAGRGGAIYKVKNLNDSGAGSLRAAVKTAGGPRVIVFEVAGTIELMDWLKLKVPYITIAGQTAPEPGIQLKNAGIYVSTHDVLIQHIRIRPGVDPVGAVAVNSRDGIMITDSSYNIVIDHVTANWATDECMDIWGRSSGSGVHDVTISNSIIADGIGGHGYGLLIGSVSTEKNFVNNISVFSNLFAHNSERNPLITNNTNVVVANNLAYNTSGVFTAIVEGVGPKKASFLNNHYISGVNTFASSVVDMNSQATGVGGEFYFDGNTVSGIKQMRLIGSTISRYQVSSPPIMDSSLTVRPVDTVRERVLSMAGARPAYRDRVELRIVNDVRYETGAHKNSFSETEGWLPEYEEPNYRAFTVPSNPNGDDDGDGYTNIEEVLSQAAFAVEGR